MYYWKAMLFYEANDLVASIDLLKQALFLEPKFILAEFMLENFLKRLGRESEAVVHLANLKLLLNAMSEDTILPESDGMSAGQLKKLIDARG
jgi:DNA recombination-dependent growth factor C